jgi:hypothetical protein
MCGPQKANVCGYIVWAKPADDAKAPPDTDQQNPDPTKRARPLLGSQMIMGMKPAQDGHFEGEIYNGDNGKTYQTSIWRSQPAQLTVRGCVLTYLCGSQAWTLATDVLPGQLDGLTGTVGGPTADAEWASSSGPAQKSHAPRAKPIAAK